MATISIRDLPGDLHEWLKTSARTQGRSLNAEILRILETARRDDEESELRRRRIDAVRARYLPTPGTPTGTLVRTLRSDRGR